MKLTNGEYLLLAQKSSPNFENQTSNWTKEIFSETGFEALSRTDEGIKSINDFFELSIKTVLNKIETQNAVDTLLEQGFGERYTNEFGGILQRIQINEIKPINPQFTKLQNFGSVDPFVIRKPKTTERFFQINNQYQNLVTIQEMEARKIFVNMYGMDDYIAGIIQALNDAYTVQTYLNKLEAINAGINSVKYPLQDSQKIQVNMSDEPTQAELRKLILNIKNIISDMKVKPATKAYNAMGFMRKQRIDDLRILVRPEVLNILNTDLLSQVFNPEKLNMNVTFVEVENFGGLKYYDLEDNLLQPVYDQIGSVIGFNQSGTGEPLPDDEIKVVDPNENVIAVIADKGYVFESYQQEYIIRTIDNPAGLYRNYWASKPNGTVSVDYAFTCVTISITPSNSKNAKK